MQKLAILIHLREEQVQLFYQAKRLIEEQLAGGISEDQFVQMMVMEAARSTVNPANGRRIDTKYETDGRGEIIKTATGEVLPHDEPLFLIRARDSFAIKALRFYHTISTCNPVKALQEFEDFARLNPDRMKQPEGEKSDA